MTLWTDEARARAKLLFESGQSFTTIATAIGGVSRSAIAGLVFRMNWTRAPTPRPPRKPRPSRSRSIISGKRNGGLASRVLHAVLHSTKLRPPGPVDPPSALAVTLMQRTARQCCWPVGEATGEFQMFCGGAKKIEVSYCAWHRAIACRRAA